MTRKAFILFTAITNIFMFIACNSSDNGPVDPFNEYDNSEAFNPKDIEIKKVSSALSTQERWYDITTDKDGNITSYKYSIEQEGKVILKETWTCTIKHIYDYTGTKRVKAKSDIVHFSENKDGIQNEYTKVIEEDIIFNQNGLITSIDTYTTKEGLTSEFTPSNKIFSYKELPNGKFICTGCVFNEKENKTEYRYNWSGYELKEVEEFIYEANKLSENNKTRFKYNNAVVYTYKGLSPLKFIINGISPIYAYMGCFGIEPPYLIEEEEKKSTYYIDNESISQPAINNIYRYYDSGKGEIIYDINSDTYEVYTITIKK